VSGSVAPDSTATAQAEPVAAKPSLVHGNQATARPAAADSTAAPTPTSPAVEAAEAKNAGDSPASPDRYCCQVSQAGRRCRYLIAEELLGSVEDFSTAASVKVFLDNIAVQLARKPTARSDTVALGLYQPAHAQQRGSLNYPADYAAVFA
jgi:hypothetical protein